MILICYPSTQEAETRVLLYSKTVSQKNKTKQKTARCQWLTPVILATQETKIRIVV
jgi:hypothetical protein